MPSRHVEAASTYNQYNYMARITNGILGSFTESAGTVKGTSWRGMNYLRSKPIKRKHLSVKQQAQVARFKLAVSFVTTLKHIISAGFAATVGKTPRNMAIAYTLHHAIQGNYPYYSIDYSLTLLTCGNLPTTPLATATCLSGGVICFGWIDNTGKGSALATDNILLICYCPALQEALYVYEGHVRSNTQASMHATAFAGHIVHTWISFYKPRTNSYSNSVYAGSLQL